MESMLAPALASVPHIPYFLLHSSHPYSVLLTVCMLFYSLALLLSLVSIVNLPVSVCPMIFSSSGILGPLLLVPPFFRGLRAYADSVGGLAEAHS